MPRLLPKVCAWSLLLGVTVLAVLAILPVVPNNVRAEPGERRHVVIAVTHQLHGSIASYSRDPDRGQSGLAYIAPLIHRLRAASPGLILVDAGGAMGGSYDPSSAPGTALPPIVVVMGDLRYDAAVLGERDLSLDPRAIAATIRSSEFPWLAANLNTSDTPLGASAIRIVERAGLRIGFIGLAAPGSAIGLPPSTGAAIRVGDVESAALESASRLRESEQADLVIALGGGGLGGGASERETAALMRAPLPQAAGRLADAVTELDLIIASRGRTPQKGENPRPDRSMRVPLIQLATGARGLTVIRLDVERAENRWVVSNVEQETLWADPEGDLAMVRLARTGSPVARAPMPEPADLYIAGRTSQRVRDTCSGELVHAAALHAASKGEAASAINPGTRSDNPSLSLLPFQWNWGRYTKGDKGRPVTSRDLRRWIQQDDRLVISTLTGRQIALMLQPYVRVTHGWKVPRVQTLYPGGIDVTLSLNRSEAAALHRLDPSEALDARANYRVWLTEYHRFGGGGVAPRALVLVDQPYRMTGISLRNALADFLADPALGLPSACERVLTHTAPNMPRKRWQIRKDHPMPIISPE
jgi:2',3'-cyclic-nucleotide 2'-phosphodiesterase (5'-nucleotidase family)